MLPFFAAIPKVAILSAMLNSAGIAIPGQSVQIDCTQPDGQTVIMFMLGDFPQPEITVSAASCAIPPGYYRAD